jgi:hypothetical protein
MSARKLSDSIFCPAYQQILFLAGSLVETAKRTGACSVDHDARKNALRSSIEALRREAANSLPAAEKIWQKDAEDALDFALETGWSMYFSGERWLDLEAKSRALGGKGKDAQDLFKDMLKAVLAGASAAGRPRALLDLWLCCLRIVFHDEEGAGATLLAREPYRKLLLEAEPMPLPTARLPTDRVSVPIVSWAVVILIVVLLGGTVWLVNLVTHQQAVERAQPAFSAATS